MLEKNKSTVETQNALRVRVAELCGWTHLSDIIDIIPTRRHWWPPGKQNSLDSRDLTYLPDYPNDLNACAEFEETLTPNQLWYYDHRLSEIVEKERPCSTFNQRQDYLWHATAKQRCRAFVKVMEGKSK